MEVTKTLRQMSFIFKLIGFVPLLFVLFFGLRLIWILSTVESTTGFVIQVIDNYENDDDSKTVIIQYSIDGIIYFGQLEVYNDWVDLGYIYRVYPKANQPDQLYQIQSHIFLLIPAFFALIFLSVGYGIYPNVMKYERKLERLRQIGKKEKATIAKVDHLRWLSVNTFSQTYHPVVIICKKKDSATGVEVIYKTHKLWGYDDRNIVPNESTVNVYIHPTNPKQYIIDLDTIRNMKDDPFE